MKGSSPRSWIRHAPPTPHTFLDIGAGKRGLPPVLGDWLGTNARYRHQPIEADCDRGLRSVNNSVVKNIDSSVLTKTCSLFIYSPTSFRPEFREKMTGPQTWSQMGLFLYGPRIFPTQKVRFRRSIGRTGGPFGIFAAMPRRRRRSTGRGPVNWSKNVRPAGQLVQKRPATWSTGRKTSRSTGRAVNWSGKRPP